MTTAEKLATSVWGVILARYVSPVLVAVAITLGGFVTSGLFKRIDDLSGAQTDIMERMADQAIRITAIEARRAVLDATSDEQISHLLEAQKTTQAQLSLVTAQIASVTAKVEVLLDRMTEVQ